MINPTVYTFLALDLPPLIALITGSISCALLGNFLILRRSALLGDTISHAVLPGLVLGFLLSHSRDASVMFIGASISGILASVLSELLRKYARIESGAAMGVVFSVMFATGVLLLEQISASGVDLDADCVLNGVLESLIWQPPKLWADFISLNTISNLPSEVSSSLIALIVVLVSVILFWKELIISSFDSDFSSSIGFSSSLIQLGFVSLVAISVVASFTSVGSILVIGMLIIPPATARLITSRITEQILISIIFALFFSIVGYGIAAYLPQLLGVDSGISASGTVLTLSGIIFCLVSLMLPRLRSSR